MKPVKGYPYPKTVAECIDPDLKFKEETLEAVRHYKEDQKPQMERIRDLHESLCGIYHRKVALILCPKSKEKNGCYFNRTITIYGRFSVLTYLHEFGHALGGNEVRACQWSLNLFKQVFPKEFEECDQVGHLLIRPKGR